MVARSQVTNSEDDEKLPYFRYVTSYVMGGEVQQKTDPDSMVSAMLAVFLASSTYLQASEGNLRCSAGMVEVPAVVGCVHVR